MGGASRDRMRPLCSAKAHLNPGSVTARGRRGARAELAGRVRRDRRALWTSTHTRSPQRAELVVLHEALHTLGLGENPPGSLEITQRVGDRCAP